MKFKIGDRVNLINAVYAWGTGTIIKIETESKNYAVRFDNYPYEKWNPFTWISEQHLKIVDSTK